MKYTVADLSRRQLEIIQLLASGYDNQEIADRLFISKRAISKSLHRSRSALGLSNNLQLGALAVSSGALGEVDLQKFELTHTE